MEFYSQDKKLNNKDLNNLFNDLDLLMKYIEDAINPWDHIDKENGILIYKKTISSDITEPDKKAILSALSKKGINKNFTKQIMENNLVPPFYYFLSGKK